MRLCHLVGFLALIFASTLHAATPPAEHPAKADLIADVTSIQPGQPFQIALRIQMKPDWHVYWIDPGDSGQATEFKFKGPDGWKIEPLAFPTPHKFTMPGDIVNNGYADTVLFMAKVTPPPEAKGDAAFSVQAEWLVCNPDMCIPGKGSPTLSLPVGSTAAPANAELFAKWAEQLPVPARDMTGDVVIKPADEAGRYTLGLWWKAPVRNVELFMAPGSSWVVKDLKTRGDEKMTAIQFSAKAVGKEKKPVDMVVLVAYDDAGGVRRSVQLSYPLKP